MDILLFFAVSVGFNLLMFLFAFRAKTDKLTDISYAATFLFLVLYGLFANKFSTYILLVSVMIVLWALRLGTFLFIRIHHMGRDSRFDAIRNNFARFGKFWLLQGLSVPVILLPAAFLFSSTTPSPTLLTYVGCVVWAAGLIIETIADLQKYRFNADPANKGRWIDSGIWRYSRHPNYLGEITVWIGVYVAVFSAVFGWQQILGLVSPLYIACLLLFVSGIPPLEKSADKRWGKNPQYREYKRRTSLLLLLPKRQG